jgi:hypothetical protein
LTLFRRGGWDTKPCSLIIGILQNKTTGKTESFITFGFSGYNLLGDYVVAKCFNSAARYLNPLKTKQERP